MKKKWEGERLETFIYGRDMIDHLHRYAIVSSYIDNKTVLDIACGEGYGSNLMSKNAKFVYSVDIDSDTILAAKSKYKKSNINFLVGSASEIPIEDNCVDIVVSFETIEHHDRHEEMVSEIRRVLKPNGIVIISTPDKLYYSDKRSFINPFHVKELYKQEFVDLFATKFKNFQLLTQTYCNGNSIIQEEDETDVQFFSGNYENVELFKTNPLYLIIIASDGVFTKQKTTIFNGDEIEKKELIAQFRDSTTYKVGQFILFPFKFLKMKL